jgi:hypothetical protein
LLGPALLHPGESQSPRAQPERTPGAEAPRAEDSGGGPSLPAPPTSLEVLIERLRRDYPDREAVVLGGDAVPRALLDFAQEHAADPALAEDVGKARLLAAEAFLLEGRRREALQVYAETAALGPLDEHRARALFVLGQDQFLRDRFVSSGRRRGADYYWTRLVERFPDSEWAKRVERPMRYILFLKGGQVAPAFTQAFERPAAENAAPPRPETYSAEGLLGQVVLIEFWTASTPGHGDQVKTLAAGLASNLKEYPDLKGKVEVLGVNLDTDREAFEAAVAAWGTPWPQCCDGRGFRTPLAEAFGVPRVPQWVVIAAGGRVVYIGADFDAFLAAASEELRRVRGVVPPGK